MDLVLIKFFRFVSFLLSFWLFVNHLVDISTKSKRAADQAFAAAWRDVFFFTFKKTLRQVELLKLGAVANLEDWGLGLGFRSTRTIPIATETEMNKTDEDE